MDKKKEREKRKHALEAQVSKCKELYTVWAPASSSVRGPVYMVTLSNVVFLFQDIISVFKTALFPDELCVSSGFYKKHPVTFFLSVSLPSNLFPAHSLPVLCLYN